MKKYIATGHQRDFEGSLARLDDNGRYVVIAEGLYIVMEELAEQLNANAEVFECRP